MKERVREMSNSNFVRRRLTQVGVEERLRLILLLLSMLSLQLRHQRLLIQTAATATIVCRREAQHTRRQKHTRSRPVSADPTPANSHRSCACMHVLIMTIVREVSVLWGATADAAAAARGTTVNITRERVRTR
jgi:hypothetical protein